MFIKTYNKGYTASQYALREKVISYWIERSEYYLNLSDAYEHVDRSKADMFLAKSYENRVEAEKVAGMTCKEFTYYFEVKSQRASR